jgi:hypothetical protein
LDDVIEKGAQPRLREKENDAFALGLTVILSVVESLHPCFVVTTSLAK